MKDSTLFVYANLILLGVGRGLTDMAIIDVVKWESNTQEFCHKFPSENLRLGTQLVVNTSQTAFFVKGGQICDEFTSGTYTIKTENIPILHKIINLPFGGNSPFQAEVWFINLINKLDLIRVSLRTFYHNFTKICKV